mgnify:FL=1
MKLYEYAAAGLPVVSRATSEIARRGDRFVFLYNDAGGVGKAAARALAQRADLARALRQAATEASWKEKARKIALFAHLIEAGRAPADRSGSFPNFMPPETTPMLFS